MHTKKYDPVHSVIAAWALGADKKHKQKGYLCYWSQKTEFRLCTENITVEAKAPYFYWHTLLLSTIWKLRCIHSGQRMKPLYLYALAIILLSKWAVTVYTRFRFWIVLRCRSTELTTVHDISGVKGLLRQSSPHQGRGYMYFTRNR